MIDPDSEVEEFSEVGKKIIGIGPSNTAGMGQVLRIKCHSSASRRNDEGMV